MTSTTAPSQKSILDAQRAHWEGTFAKNPALFGESPSAAAVSASQVFRKAGVKRVLELGAGHGRDAIFFARNGFEVTAVEYSQAGINAMLSQAARGLGGTLTPLCHDVREELPFENESFEAGYAHMLFCMALTTAELQRLARSVWRVLKPGGIMVYTARTVRDPQYHTGTHRGEQMYEIEGGYIVHFFDDEMAGRLSAGYEVLSVEAFEEGALPRRLVRVTQRKKPG